MAEEKILMTPAGYAKLEQELEELKTVRTAEVSEMLKEAISHGDISENAEYDAAKNAQAELNERIEKVEYMLRNAEVIEEEDIGVDHVNLGHTVKVEYMSGEDKGDIETYKIVGSNESDPLMNLISNVSPVGSALIGHSKDSIVEVELPDNEIVKVKILEISR